jgi:lipopolysaccharide/colanic/teichoic acid biosynthesis glycosyltransferase
MTQHQSREPTVPSSQKKASSLSTGAGLDQRWMSPVIRWTAEPVFQEPALVERTRPSWTQEVGEWARRALNVSVAAVSLLVISPLLLLIAIAVKLSSPGPVIYKQERIGLDRRRRMGDRRTRRRGTSDRRGGNSGGKVFRMFKFRTMYEDHGENGQVWAQKDDPRITPVGRLLRAYRLDELPQLWNVILGDMNIVGPRPEQPEIFKELREEISDYPRRQQVLPGITGWAQINNGYDKTFKDVERKLGRDLEYLERRSPSEDVKIMAKTVPVVLSRKGYH